MKDCDAKLIFDTGTAIAAMWQVDGGLNEPTIFRVKMFAGSIDVRRQRVMKDFTTEDHAREWALTSFCQGW